MTLYLFQQDLRIHDQALLNKALDDGSVIGLFIFPDTWFSTDKDGIVKKDVFYLSFVYQTLLGLNHQLKTLNVPLIIKKGAPKDILNEIISTYDITSIYFETLPGYEERLLYSTLQSFGLRTVTDQMKPLYKTHALPFEIKDLPFVFTQFRKQIERLPKIFTENLDLIPQEKISIDSIIPNPDALGITFIQHELIPGEKAALKHLHAYLFEKQLAKTYKETRNGMLLFNDSTKFSAYLATGALSVRKIMNQLSVYEKTHTKNESTYWIYFELLWRDYFYYAHLQHGDRIFTENGLGNRHSISKNPTLIQAWMQGNTGYPLIDANMRQLNQTGFMSNRGRQNVANFFTKFLKQDWRIGANYFESKLIDYDVSSNTLNWLYASGLGNDPRENRMFNYITQGERYDKHCHFIDTYLPELKHLPNHLKYKVSELSEKERQNFNIHAYPKPIKRFYNK